MPPEHWSAVSDTVRDVVLSIDLQTVGTVRQYLAVVSGFVHWAWQTTGTGLDAADLFQPHLVGRYISEQMVGHSDNYRHLATQKLSRVMATTNNVHMVQGRRHDQHASNPYSFRELTEFRSSAARRSNHERRRNAHTFLALGAGAGLRAEEIANARASDITNDGIGLVVAVRGKQARSVPVLAAWERCLLAGLEGRVDDGHAFVGYRLPGYPARVLHQFGIDDPKEATPAATRLRATWIVGRLNAGLPVDLLLRLAGLSSVVSLDCYVRAMNVHNADDFRELVTGRRCS
jgi:integrase